MSQRTTIGSELFSRFVNPVIGVLRSSWRRGRIRAETLTVLLAGLIGVGAGLGAVLFTELIDFVGTYTVNWANQLRGDNGWWWLALIACPPLGLLVVSWFTRQFAREAQGHGVPEVITAIARHDGVIRPRVAIVKILASGVCHTQLLECRGLRGPDPYLPHCLGHEGSGIVLEVGPEVSKVSVGSQVVLSWIKGAKNAIITPI